MVTGGAGFIGSHLVDKLVEEGKDVVVVDNLTTGKKINLNKKAKFIEIDITDSGISKVFENENFDAVCHFAASTNVRKSVENPLNDIKTNVLGMVNLLEACKKHGIKKVVFSSTGGALYGNTDKLPTLENHPTRPISPYGIDKLAGENFLYYYNKVHGLPVTILRYSNVYGPRQDRKGEGGVVAVFIKQLMEKQTPIINGDGEQTRDFIYVSDIANANALALEQEERNESFNIYNISGGAETSINDLLGIISKKLSVDLKPEYGPKLKGEILRSCLDNSLATKELNFVPKYNLEKGIDATIQYFLR